MQSKYFLGVKSNYILLLITYFSKTANGSESDTVFFLWAGKDIDDERN